MRDVLYLFPQLALSSGGIQAVNEDTLRAVARAWPDARHRILLYLNRRAPRLPDDVGGDVRALPCGMPSRRLAKLRFAGVFAKLLAARRPDLVVVGHVDLAPLAWLAQRALRIPYVVWGYGIDVWGLRAGLRAASLRHAARVVAISRYTAREVTAFDAGLAERTVIVPPAVGDRFRPGAGEALRRRRGFAGARVLLTVGRLSAAERYKGIDTVLSALPRVLARAPDVRYVVAGAGDDLPRLRALAARLGVSHATLFAGAPPDADLPGYYNACDLFVMPSRREGFGIVFAEALACGKPVLAAAASGAPDAVLDGGLGRLVEPGDADATAQAVLDFLDGRWPPALTDPARLRRTCLEHFGFTAFERRVTDLVRSVVPPLPAGRT